MPQVFLQPELCPLEMEMPVLTCATLYSGQSAFQLMEPLTLSLYFSRKNNPWVTHTEKREHYFEMKCVFTFLFGPAAWSTLVLFFAFTSGVRIL